MKTPKILLWGVLASLSVTAFAQRMEFFSIDRRDASGMPRALGRDCFGGYYHDHDVYEMEFEKWFDGPYATGNWFCFRSFLEDVGIVPNISYLGNFAANPSGGMSRGASVTSSVNLGYGIDLEKITGSDSLRGWSFVNTWVWRFGDSLTKRRIDNQFNVQQNYGSQTMMLQSLYLAWTGKAFGGADVMVKFGRIAAGDNFMTKPIYWLYQNNAIDGNPVGVFNQTRFSAYPGSTWGAMVQLDKNGYYGKAGVYQINNADQDSGHRHGLDWSFSTADGVNANFELGYDINHDDSGKSPGNVSAGAVLDWYSAAHLDNPDKNSHFNPSFYVQADYMVWNMGFPNRDDAALIRRSSAKDVYRDLRGIILWGVVQYDPYDELAKIPFFANGGLLFNAPFESRPDDVLAFGAAYGKYSGKLSAPEKNSYEIMLELNYKVQVNRFFFVQPNMQYIINTKGGQHPNAFVLGCQFGMGF